MHWETDYSPSNARRSHACLSGVHLKGHASQKLCLSSKKVCPCHQIGADAKKCKDLAKIMHKKCKRGLGSYKHIRSPALLEAWQRVRLHEHCLAIWILSSYMAKWTMGLSHRMASWSQRDSSECETTCLLERRSANCKIWNNLLQHQFWLAWSCCIWSW